ncbi:MAG TPA: esterase [Burkholderiaceae bacterium]
MPSSALIVHQPATPTQLVLLFHGVGSVPQSMLGVGRQIAAARPTALVLSVASPDASDIAPGGLQWFSVRGVTEDNRQPRVDAAMPQFVDTVRGLQRQCGLDAAHTVIAGFSQGGIMALESAKLAEPPAARLAALAGRFATLPQQRLRVNAVHLLHGQSDPVMPYALAQSAYARLQQLGTPATLDVVPGLGHEPHPALVERLLAHLV